MLSAIVAVLLLQWFIGQGYRDYMNIPFLGMGLFSSFNNKLSLSRLRALDEYTVLFVEFTQHTSGLSLMNHAFTLSAAACITWPLLTGSDVG